MAPNQYSRRIIHRELVGSVNGSVAFAVTEYHLNPGIAATFPWLSTQAVGWEQYRFDRLSFEFVTRTATTTLGSVILSPEYDASDLPPANEAAATNAMDAVEDAPWKNITCTLNSAAMYPLGPRKFIRNARLAGDIRTFDSGTFYLCRVEEAGADPIGKLWVSYDVELSIPQTAVSAPAASQTSFSRTLVPQTVATGVPELVDWPVPIVDAMRIYSLPLALQTTFTPPAGAYTIDTVLIFDDSAAEAFTVVANLLKNGAMVDYVAQNITSIAGGYTQVSLHSYLSCNGTDTFAVQASCVGAAGVLRIDGGSTLRIQAA